MDKSELPEEITTLIKAAEAGDAKAQFKLGVKYRKGQGVEQSDYQAVKWYRRAAEQGNTDAQCNIGWMYQEGIGIEQNDHQAVDWYRKAAEQGDADAQCNLGWMYEFGRGVEQSAPEAVVWYRKAAEQGNANAQCNLGWMYQFGQGVERNAQEAIDWYNKSVAQNNARAQFNLGLMYMHGHGVATDYTQAKILFTKSATADDHSLHFESIEHLDQIERYITSPKITKLRTNILNMLKVNFEKHQTMTHYTSLLVGEELLLKKSSLRLGHINSLNDPNEGKLLWRYLECTPMAGNPVFVGCFLPDDDSLNMWRFYSKNHHNDDACGCAITFNTSNFFDFDLLQDSTIEMPQIEKKTFVNTGRSPRESTAFYRIIYINDDMSIDENNESGAINKAFSALKKEVRKFLEETPGDNKLQQLSRLLGPLPYLVKDADYAAEKEHRIIISHLEYGAKEIQALEPTMENGIPQTAPKLYLALHRAKHLDPVKHVTLGPKAPHQEMMAPYWHHKLASDFPDQLKDKPDFYIRSSKCAYK